MAINWMEKLKLNVILERGLDTLLTARLVGCCCFIFSHFVLLINICCYQETHCPFPGYLTHGKVLLVGHMGLYDYRPDIHIRRAKQDAKVVSANRYEDEKFVLFPNIKLEDLRMFLMFKSRQCSQMNLASCPSMIAC